MVDTFPVPRPDCIQFLFEPLPELHKFGDYLTFFNGGRIPGTVAIENEVLRHNQRFERQFGDGFVARNPGPLERQRIHLVLNGMRVEHWVNHTRELSYLAFGARPFVEIERYDGQITHFTYRRRCIAKQGIVPFGEDVWCRAIPMISDVPMPYGFLSRQFEQVWDLATLAVIPGGICTALGAAYVQIAKSMLQ